jgi:exopolyphosphatase/guanosine-5'-triphosphate,3'-diphosphate pyrophosphatase
VSARAGDRLAVIDLGSNSTRLLLAEGLGPGGARGERVTTVTGLRRGAAPDGTPAPEALARLDACLAGYAARIDAFAPGAVVAVGTSAVREAPDRSAVAGLLRDRLGVGLRVLTGEEEARAAFAGARLAAEGPGACLMVDVGGGSTELVRGGPEGPAGAVSLPLGSVRQTERHLAGDPPAADELDALRREARDLLRDGLAAVGGSAPVVGVAGTVTTLAALELGGHDPGRVHGHRLSRGAVERELARLAAMTAGARRDLPGMEHGRAEVIVAGAAIVAEALAAAGRGGLIVSERDLLDGVAMAAADPSSGPFRL